MRELFLLLPLHVDLVLLMLLLLACLLPSMACRRRDLPMEPASRSFRRSYLATLLSGCLLMLSGCGTAPLPAALCPPVPAELMEPPQEPVPLQRPSNSVTPGTTTPRTPPDAASTGRGTSA